MNNNYTRTHDIDWFCVVSGKLIHVASAGGRLPKSIKSLTKLHEWQRLVDSSPIITEVELNREYIRREIIRNDYAYFDNDYMHDEFVMEENDFIDNLGRYDLTIQEKLYYNTFISMACRGLYSFDRNLNNENHDTYHLVAKPKKTNVELLNLLIEDGVPTIDTRYVDLDNYMYFFNNIDLVDMIDFYNR